MGITICGKDLKNSIIDGQNADVERPTTEVKDKYILLATLLIQTVGNGGGGWFVDYSGNIETGDHASVLGSLSLSIIEVRWRRWKGNHLSTIKITTASLIFFPRNASAVSFILSAFIHKSISGKNLN
ncbi:unnamed protein product [Spirodela intermedia]|uniref:Uncharacterized protein n=2 Tax=Spirodela intermedia TaxID=51605 RepID=A0A7I8J929_SPIIN|nr:unnamed protein product [Spirodela intermedia]CAA6666594.1 unnamed protein product [Spirodela intermedia]CAA7403390.1 unnamed protein product [Spirodela intermedia]